MSSIHKLGSRFSRFGATFAALAALGAPLTAHAQAKGDWLVSFRAGAVVTSESTEGIPNIGPVGLTPEGFTPGTDVGLGDSPLATVIPGYMLTNWLAIDAFIATPAFSDVDIVGLEALGVTKAAEIGYIVPALSLTLYPADPSSAWQPSFSAGVGSLIFIKEKQDAALEAALGAGTETDFKNDDLVLVFRAGLDYKVSEKWMVGGHFAYTKANITARVEPTGQVPIGPGVTAPLGGFDIDVEVPAKVFQVALTRTF